MKRNLKLYAAVIAAFLIALFPVAAQVAPTSPVWALTNAVVVDATFGAYTNLSSNARPIDVPQDKGIALMAHYGGSSTLCNTAMIGIAWALRVDGTNYCSDTNQYLWQLIMPNGEGPQFSYTNFPATLLQGADKMKIVQITNYTLSSTAAWFRITNVWVGK